MCIKIPYLICKSLCRKSLMLESLGYIKKSEDEVKLKKIILENTTAIKIANNLLNLEEKSKMRFKTTNQTHG